MNEQILDINPRDYGLVIERSEDRVYLMKKCESRPGWAEEVAVRLDGEWNPSRGAKYMVLAGDVAWAKEEDKSKLLKILEEAEKNS